MKTTIQEAAIGLLEAKLSEQAEEIQRLHNLVESLNAIIEEEMGEWYGVEYAYLPVSLSNIAHMRDAIHEELAKVQS
jgi:hypothetical protein